MTDRHDNPTIQQRDPFAVVAIVSLAIVLGLSLIFATDVFFLVFLGILFAVFLVRTTVIVQRFVPLSYGWMLSVLITTLMLGTVGTIAFFGVSIETQLDKTAKELERSSQKVRTWLDQNPHTMALLGQVPFAGRILNVDADNKEAVADSQSHARGLMVELEHAITGERQENADASDEDERTTSKKSPDQNADSGSGRESEPKDQPEQKDLSSIPSPNLGKLSQQATSATGTAVAGLGRFFSRTFGLLASSGLILFVGLFIAADPTLYRDGFVKLLPKHHRTRATEIMNKIGLNLYNWLNGRFIAMAITGIGTGIGLWILGVPLAAVVGIVTALMTFIPNIGGFIALLLAMLMGLSQGPATVVWVVILYGGLQLVESNLITPLVQQQKTSIPPALLLAFQLLMGVLTGFLGLLVATPLLAGLMVLVKEAWIADVLGDDNIDTPEVA